MIPSPEDKQKPEDLQGDPHFDIDASIVFQLGESLITDPLQALVELIKNSYDAGATGVEVTIDTGAPPAGSHFPDARGFIEVRDSGIGMDRSDLIRGWLTISASPKRKVKREQSKPEDLPLGRFPLGDKGLGRLGVQRLGENVEIATRPTRKDEVSKKDVVSDREYRLAFSWDEFRKVERLSEVHVPIDELPAVLPPGTSIMVSDLKEVKVWEDGKLLGSLQGRLAELVSPFVEVPSFDMELSLNGQEVDLLSITQDVLKAAMVEYNLAFDGHALEMSGKARLNYLRPDSDDDVLFHELVERDNGVKFLSYLSQIGGRRRFRIERAEGAGWLVGFTQSKHLAELDGVELRDGEIANPGPFTGKVYYFDYKKSGALVHTLQTPADLPSFVRNLSGIHVYRDGFGVRTGEDWLRLAHAVTVGTSWYGLRPANTLGYVAISSRENFALEETTDREGFKDTPEYRNFYALLRLFVKFSAEVQEFLRRGWNQYKAEHTKERGFVPRASTPEARAAELNRRLVAAAPAVGRIRTVQSRIANEVQRVEQTYRDSIEALTASSPNPASIERALAGLDTHQRALQSSVQDIQRLLRESEAFLGSIEQLRAYSELVQNDIATMRTQLGEVYEMVSLGLTAEALSHEIGNVLTQLSHRTRDFRAHLKRSKASDPKTVLFAEYVHESVRALRKQLAHLAPSLRYVREQRTEFSMRTALGELADYYRIVFERREPAVKVVLVEVADFLVRINRGKLTQVIDNLILNSEYWLLEDARIGHIREPTILIEIDEPWVRVSDNGRGVDPTLEDAIFEPFVTGKAAGTGRGLGLFIVQQLLQAEGCSITLTPHRNTAGRRHIFQIDFSGAIHAGTE